jgi:hypothetical protein
MDVIGVSLLLAFTARRDSSARSQSTWLGWMNPKIAGHACPG